MPGGFVVRDANGQALAYVYSRASETDAMQAKVLTDDEARRIAANIAKLPVLLARESREALEAIKAEVGSLLFSAMTAPRPHCVAEDAVLIGPVSAPDSLLTGKLTGNFADSTPLGRFLRLFGE